jgi:ubiquinone biosynthesis protein UbiJ
MLPLPAPIQAAINHVLGQAAWAREKLMPFAGHAAQIKLPPFEAAFLITRTAHAAPEAGAELEVAISCRHNVAACAARQGRRQRGAHRGSAEFAQALGFVIRNLRWDAEEDLSRLVGDVAAHRIVKGGKEFAAWQQQAAQNFAANLAEYFTEEQPLIAKQADIAAFSADIDRLRDDVARLEKRLQLIG